MIGLVHPRSRSHRALNHIGIRVGPPAGSLRRALREHAEARRPTSRSILVRLSTFAFWHDLRHDIFKLRRSERRPLILNTASLLANDPRTNRLIGCYGEPNSEVSTRNEAHVYP